MNKQFITVGMLLGEDSPEHFVSLWLGLHFCTGGASHGGAGYRGADLGGAGARGAGVGGAGSSGVAARA
ncbi:unnamed protein product [Closterium sp. NIES-54]